MTQIETIASTHLGKAGDGTIVKPYVTPDHVDASLLVAIPRYLNRVNYGIDKNTVMLGYDTWNAYEVSFLLDNGFPVNCVAKIIYSSESESIVESKSLKLYLNSLNMQKFGNSIDAAIGTVEELIAHDLSKALQTDVSVSLFIDLNYEDLQFLCVNPFDNLYHLETELDVASMDFPYYNENLDILKEDYDTDNGRLAIRSSSLRSNCRVTNQPDWGDVFIVMEGDRLPTLESVLQYIVSMRKENHFHEEICECIYKRLLDKFEPSDLLVGCLYTRRGGIDINPVRANNMELLMNYSGALMTPGVMVSKTMRQ